MPSVRLLSDAQTHTHTHTHTHIKRSCKHTCLAAELTDKDKDKEWNGMEWNGMEWNGMEWNGTDEQTTQDGMGWDGMMDGWDGERKRSRE